VLGAAWIADRAVMPAIAASSNGRLVAIASRDEGRAGALAARHGVERVSRSYEALLEDPEVEAVYVPLVNSLHREWTVRALAAGKHVLCEKPLGVDAAEAEEMGAAAQGAGLQLMEAFMYRFHPRMRALVEGVKDPIHVHATFGFPLEDRGNPRLDRALGGGALLDVGCYTVSVARWIMGEPEEVIARVRIDEIDGIDGIDGIGGVDVTVGGLLRFGGGRLATVWASFESPEVQELVVVSKAESVRVEEPFTAMDPDPYRLMVESFGESVLGGGPVAIPISESIANMRVLDRMREAAGIRDRR
jgi:D-xylose 1-dehydrogenase (NADP+, D-xylono-1,5-lactone-forming)